MIAWFCFAEVKLWETTVLSGQLSVLHGNDGPQFLYFSRHFLVACPVIFVYITELQSLRSALGYVLSSFLFVFWEGIGNLLSGPQRTQGPPSVILGLGVQCAKNTMVQLRFCGNGYTLDTLGIIMASRSTLHGMWKTMSYWR